MMRAVPSRGKLRYRVQAVLLAHAQSVCRARSPIDSSRQCRAQQRWPASASLPKFVPNVLRMPTNFGIGPLVRAAMMAGT
jgi:hypothetical protein